MANERVRGVEPLSRLWKSRVIPLYDTRAGLRHDDPRYAEGYGEARAGLRPREVGVLGIEPSLHAPKARVLPVYDTPLIFLNLAYFHLFFNLCYNKIMDFKEVLKELNIVANCRKYGISIWQCPQFLFVIMGLVIMVTSLTTYVLGTRYVADPDTVSLIVLAITIVLFVITFSMTRSMEGLAEANRLKSEFVSIVSHQLRSPLSNLKWAIELLLSGRLGEIDGKQGEYFKILKDNATRMEELVADLLIVSRLEQGRFPLNKSAFSLEELTKEIILTFEPAAKAAHVEIKPEVINPLPKAWADASRIKMVIENFLDNAIRYTKEKGEIKIKIELKRKTLLFSVRDNGVGIPKGDQKHIFQKFFRSKNILKYQTQGSGLGLFIAKSLVEKSGGKVGFQSQENKGSMFWFTIPTK